MDVFCMHRLPESLTIFSCFTVFLTLHYCEKTPEEYAAKSETLYVYFTLVHRLKKKADFHHIKTKQNIETKS